MSVCDSDDQCGRTAPIWQQCARGWQPGGDPWTSYFSRVLAVLGTSVSGLAGGEVPGIGGAGKLLAQQARDEQH